jgi:hypothetical protein
VKDFFEIGSLKLFARGWLLTKIFLISASWVGRITGGSHWRLANTCNFFNYYLSLSVCVCLSLSLSLSLLSVCVCVCVCVCECVCIAGDPTQGLVNPRQALYHWAPSPPSAAPLFCFSAVLVNGSEMSLSFWFAFP